MLRLKRRALAMVLCLVMAISLLPTLVFAETVTTENTVTMKEGDVRDGFVPAGTVCTSNDPSVAWVDDSGNLKALKTGAATISAVSESGSKTKYEVKVEDYTDGSEVAGNLKLLVRYNDSMKFYDGHVYLLFTSYLDNVEIGIEDLYAAYDISDRYYKDIRKNISAGSNHTGTDTSPYFTFIDTKGPYQTTLDRGEIVTIGMYRGFDLSIEQAAYAVLLHSTLGKELLKAGKTAAVKAIFELLHERKISPEAALEEFIAVFKEIGLDYTKWIDGVAEGGLCFNRELYNQKLEWDQYENVTYELDITRNQLNDMISSMNRNLNRFSIVKNSCATVAMKAWNAAVGLRDGSPTAYFLETNGSGLSSFFDTPQGIRENVEKNLPGYYLNNSEGVAEPDAGFRDETGWVYVSAPEKISEDEPVIGAKPLRTTITKPEDSTVETTVYRKNGELIVPLGANETVDAGTKIYVKPVPTEEWVVLTDISLNGDSVFDQAHFDEAEGAYYLVMPDQKSKLRIVYEYADIYDKADKNIQVNVGETLNVSDFADLIYGDDQKRNDRVRWSIRPAEEEGQDDVIAYTDDSRKVLKTLKPGYAFVWACAEDNESVWSVFNIFVYENKKNMAAVSYDENTEMALLISEKETGQVIPFSGFLVEKGTVLKAEMFEMVTNGEVLTKFLCNGEPVRLGDDIVADGDLFIEAVAAKGTIEGVPSSIRLEKKGDSFQLNATVPKSCDPRIVYSSSDPLVEVDETGRITVAGDVPAEGRAVIVTARAVAGTNVTAPCKVTVGNYEGSKIAGALTIWARPIQRKQLIPHCGLAFTPYEDTDLNVSYYEYFKPNKKYIALMQDYAAHPEKYPSDPSVYSDAIPIKDRESYFDPDTPGAKSTPKTVRLKKGESVNLSFFSFGESDLELFLDSLTDSSLMELDPQAAVLAEQIEKYISTGQVDGDQAFEATLRTLILMYLYTDFITEGNPIDGPAEGGLTINREIYQKFCKENISYTPNKYYTIEITADELEILKAYLADRQNNSYTMFNKNCASGLTDIWNAVLAEKPELHLSANLTGLGGEPESLYFEINRLTANEEFDGEGGRNYSPSIGNIEPEPVKPVARPKNTAITSVKGEKKAFTVKWKKVQKNSSGYLIRYSTAKNFKSGTKKVYVKKNSVTSKKIKGLKSGKTYYVSVRTYRKVKGKIYYSPKWSAAKKVKVK